MDEEPAKLVEQIKMGRPKIHIKWPDFEKLCILQCTLVEIAGWFGVCEDTIESRVKEEYGLTFSEYYKRFSGKGKISLRRSLFKAAEKGNVVAMIWLSKQHLGFSDKATVKQDGALVIEHIFGEDEDAKSSDTAEQQDVQLPASE